MTVSDNRIEVENLSHAYQQRQALDNVSFDVSCGEIFGLLGPNGSGKTTLFRILSTLMPVTSGTVRILGHDLATEVKAIRNLLGVVFQHPGLDAKLTVVENLRHHGHLYGLAGKTLHHRISELLERFGLSDRAKERVEILSSGLQRRVEIAKALLHSPRVLLLDEPTSGLDVTARRQLSDYLGTIAQTENILVLLTTHLLDDAEACNRVGILDIGRLVALGEPDELKNRVGGDVILIESTDNETLGIAIAERFRVSTIFADNHLRIECKRGHEFVRDVVATFPDEIQTIRFGKPTLEDVFVKLTGNPFL
ncbi:ABC transporter ATP-binding protein [Candidatus Poribacteria bacterium]|nr:ABC transporter ATP-binding protein [Candidatus Poribacteria bacterium]MYG07620.1 ABC transporter ATP-binding protein [Candidatus Poribacteria bacterium]MYK24642.1 ABC transporter ATP-binding protein [Candidatus Poribacteria bacterium]